MSYSLESKPLTTPSLEDIASTIEYGLRKNFETVAVSVENCPDLSKPPFNLPGSGLCGSPRIADVGGPPFLLPLVNRSKIYDISKLTELIGLPDAFVFGAGAGPFNHVGVNSEMMPNLVTGKNANNNSRVCKIENDNYKLVKLPQQQGNCGLMINMFASEGLPGNVLKVKVKKRTGSENFVTCIRKALAEKYQENSVGLGGIFRLVSGEAKCHVMPDFSTVPINSDDEVANWLKFFNFPAPMVFFSVLVSQDPGLDLRVEHSHGYGETYGGHYHCDVTPDTVEYEAYYQVAETIYRIDRPIETHQMGRD